MKKNDYSDSLEECFDFLDTEHHLKQVKASSRNYALYAEYRSSSVGVLFVYEFREQFPDIQFSILDSEKTKTRPGLYTLKGLYESPDFVLKSYYLAEIIEFKTQREYGHFFQGLSKIEEKICLSGKLVKEYASEFLGGNELCYLEMDKWLRVKVINAVV